MVPTLRPVMLSLLGCIALSALAPAQTIPLLARLDGAQETPPVVTPATGLGFCAIDTAALTLTFREVYQGLTGLENAAHIHGFSTVGVPSGIQLGQALGALKCGVWNMTPAQQAQVLAGLAYFNVHTTTFGGGEIRGQILEVPNQATFCYGDGSAAACPCANFSAVGDNEGCLHLPGIGGRLVGYVDMGSTSPSIANDRLVLHALRLPAQTFILFFQGTAPMAGGAGVPFGNGLLCITGTLTRLPIKPTCNGQAGLPEPGDLPISVSGAVTPGTYHYQGWFRTSPPFCTTSTQFFNLTNAVTTNWIP